MRSFINKTCDAVAVVSHPLLWALGLFVSILATNYLYDGKSYIVWWIVFLFLWPILGTALWFLLFAPLAVLVTILKDSYPEG